ncbi:aminoglycoside phosphotransferase family protein [Paenibacillus sp. MMO-177]|uniref:aminoglycoside phosphotransferase family protein n=1 Tax=Paenibacillus sp. MMO-177 TaxID=3081289 RepID=UPI0030192A20
MANPYTKARIHKIVRRFGLSPLGSNPVASFYRKNAVLQVKTRSGTYAIKPFFRNKFLRTSTIHQIKTTTRYVQLLMNGGFGYMPAWLESKSERLWTLDQGRPFYVTAWIKGRKLEKQEDFIELGRALVTLHTISNGFLQTTRGASARTQIRYWEIQDRLFRRRMAKAVRKNERNRRWYLNYGEQCNKFSNLAWTELRSPEIIDLLDREPIRPVLIHNDITSPNVIISDDGPLFLIDWDHVKVGSIYVELAKALINTCQFNPDFMHSLLNGYEELYPLNRTERKLISLIYRLPREAWQATLFPNRPISRETLSIMERTWADRLKAMDLLDDWSNQ